ncbi:hypothetical protein [Cloacibacterium caeni]|jgi:hypothetical protein|uniref:hypothetical protein n=1 Tax=Cloacibacterium caeni TaxID=2004710 RepID=UPI001BCD3D54|nr:hypothetical protein [Cloacibacterium caeni]
MAKPIKITPVLRGRDAVNFLSKMRVNKRQDSNSTSKLVEVRKDAAIFKSLLKKA